MTLLFDTSILIAIEKNEKSIVSEVRKLSALHPSPAFVSFISYVEYLVGLENVSSEKKVKLMEFLMRFHLLHTTDDTAILLAHLKSSLSKNGITKSLTDLFIAAQSIEHNLTLITKDKDFENISGLKYIILK